jgi:hypothetical protein
MSDNSRNTPKRDEAQLQVTIRQVERLSLSLPIMEKQFQDAIDEAIKQAEQNGVEVDIDDPTIVQAQDALSKFKQEIETHLRDVIAGGESLSIEMNGCRKLAESLRGGLDKPSPLSLTFDALVEMRELKDRLTTNGGGEIPPAELTAAIGRMQHGSPKRLGQKLLSDKAYRVPIDYESLINDLFPCDKQSEKTSQFHNAKPGLDNALEPIGYHVLKKDGRVSISRKPETNPIQQGKKKNRKT